MTSYIISCKKSYFFASNYGIITELNYASKAVEKEKWAGLKSNLHKL